MRTRGRLVALGLAALAASQAGHFLAYWLRFGPSGVAMQTVGPHRYFPITSTAIGGISGSVLLLLLGAIAASRLLLGRGLAYRKISGWRFLDLLPGLFVAQLCLFVAQESLESAISGTPGTSGLALVLFGALGQLPAAALAALIASWLSTRFEAAVRTFKFALEAIRAAQPQPLALLPAVAPASLRQVLAEASPASLTKRGPPPTLLFS